MLLTIVFGFDVYIFEGWLWLSTLTIIKKMILELARD